MPLAAARASALMESIEHHHAEHVHLPLKLGTANELRRTHRLVDAAGLPRLSVRAFHEDLRLFWVAGSDLVGGDPTWVPFEVVLAQMIFDPRLMGSAAQAERPTETDLETAETGGTTP